MIRTFLASVLLWAASRLIPKAPPPRVELFAKGLGDEVFHREVTLYRLRIADGYLGRALGWKAPEVRQ